MWERNIALVYISSIVSIYKPQRLYEFDNLAYKTID